MPEEKKTNSTSKRLFGQRPLRSWRLWGLILLITYSLLGFLGAPYIIKSQLIKKTPELIDRQLSVNEVQLNPFALSLTIEGISLADLDDVELVGLDRLHVNFEASSLFRWAWTFSEISFSQPRFNLRIDESGAPSFADILKGDDATVPEQTKDTNTEDAAMPRLVIQLFQVSGGQFKFEDRSIATPYNQSIDPLNFKLVDFSTLPDKEGPYGIHVELPGGGLVRWQGEVSVNPLRSEGNLELSALPLNTAWRYVQDQLRFSLDSGSLSGKLDYNFYMGGSGPEFSANGIQLGLDSVAIRDKTHKENDLEFPKISLSGGRFNLRQQTVHFDEFAIEGGKIDTFMKDDGTLHLAELFTPLETTSSQKTETTVEAEQTAQDVNDETENKSLKNTAPEKTVPWLFELDRALINAFNIRFIDRTTEPDAEIRLDDISIAVTDITNQTDDRFGLNASLKLNDEGLLKITGEVGAIAPMADLSLDIKTLPLTDFQAYLNQATNIGLVSGNASLKGNFLFKESEKDANIKLSGQLGISDFVSENRMVGGKVASWKTLTLDGIDLKLQPNKLDIDSITLDRLHGRIAIAKDGEINVASLVKTSDTPPPVKEETAAKQPAEPFPMSVGVVSLKNAAVSFTDSTVKPRFSSRLNKVKGSIKGLSSENLARADVDISGRIDDYATLLVTGQINPLSENLYTDLKLKFSNYDMVSLTPYTGRYIGNAIDKGRMSFDLNYLVSEKDLKGENKVLLNQFTLGKTIESKDAVNLPIGLAIALLKDTKGIIDIDVPVGGNLDDPEFRLSGMIFSALGNVITNIAASPFKMLAKLAGGGDDMDNVLFLPGGLELLPEHNKRLETLSKALMQRPQLLLEVRGQYDTKRDKFVLQKQKLHAQLKASEEAPPKDMPLDSLEVAVLEKHYIGKAGADAITALKKENSKVEEGAAEDAPKVLDEPKYKTALLQSLITMQAVSDDELRDLARLRADTVRNHFVNVGGLDANRIFVLEAASDESDIKEGVVTQFMLTAN